MSQGIYMKKMSILLVLIFSALSGPVHALTSSIAVPCYYKHFHYLPTLLESITQQTVLPEKIVISLSQIEHLNKEEVDHLEAGPWPFQVDIIRREGIFMEGSNRTTAVLHCSSDIVLCIDADDIPHPQRIEAVLQLFEAVPNAQMVLCGHAYPPKHSIICDSSIPIIHTEEYMNTRFELSSGAWLRIWNINDLQNWPTGVHNGSPSIRRTMMDHGYRWPDLKNGADQAFNHSILKDGHESYLIQLPLLHYYNGRSSGADINREDHAYQAS